MRKVIVSLIVSTCVLMIMISGVIVWNLYAQTATVTANEVISMMPLEATQGTSKETSSIQQMETTLPVHEIIEDTIKKKQQITISAVGDCTLGSYKGQDAWNRFDQVAAANGLDYFMKNVRDVFEQDDLTIINLEGPLTLAPYGAEKQFVMRGDPQYIEILTGSSIEAANLANNHTYDCGERGYEDTKQLLVDNQIGAFGYDRIHYKEIDGIQVALIGYKAWDAGKQTKDKVKKLIDQAKLKADLVIMMFHWGEESNHLPNEAQRQLGQYTIDCGVDLVLGSHPHVIQGIETYKGKNIVYSLGNFSFGGNRNPKDKDTFIYQETFELREGEIISIRSEVIPCTISSVGDKNNYQPQISKDDTKILERLKKYSLIFDTSYFN
ncbi:MAG: CapA family protein [Cellulosilyticaceae bacterium]